MGGIIAMVIGTLLAFGMGIGLTYLIRKRKADLSEKPGS